MYVEFVRAHLLVHNSRVKFVQYDTFFVSLLDKCYTCENATSQLKSNALNWFNIHYIQ